MKKLSLGNKLILVFGAILVASLLVPFSYYSIRFQDAVENEAKEKARSLLMVTDFAMHEKGGFSGAEGLNDFLLKISKKEDFLRLTYIASGGGVIADSGVPYSKLSGLDNHASRPEVAAAQAGDLGVSVRYSGSIEKELIYAALASKDIPGIPDGVLRISIPYSRTKTILDEMNSHMLGFGAVSFLVFMGLTSLIVTSLTRSLRGMIDAILAIGSGDYTQRLWDSPGKEFDPLIKAINYLAKSFGEQIETIKRQKMELEAVFNGMREGVMILDSNGRIFGGNESLQKIFPDILENIGVKPLEGTMIPELQTACDRIMDFEAVSDRDSAIVNIEVATETGRSYDVNIVPLESGKERGAMVVLHDITEIKRVEKIRRDFVANVSHEMRTPLTSIKGYAETLVDSRSCPDENSQEFLNTIIRNANTMNGLLEDILVLSRLESNEVQPDFREVDLAHSLHSALKCCDLQIKARKAEVVSKIEPGTLNVMADPSQTVQVFINLIENAVKYIPEKSGRIEVTGRVDAENVTVCIDDNGPGISEGEHKRIFERFYRVEKHRNSKVSGTGLGLSICKHILRSNKGKIWVESPVPGSEHGCRFCFTLPRTKN